MFSKSGLLRLFFCNFIILTVVIMSSQVLAIGVSPASIVLDYDIKEGIEGTFPFTVISNSAADYDVTIQIEGAEDGIRQYTSISSQGFLLKSTERIPFTFEMNIPPGLDDEYAGPQGMFILIQENALQAQAGISVTTAVRIPVKISFPYPGQYLEFKQFTISNINKGEKAVLNWAIQSKGKERALYTADLEIFSADGSLALTRNYEMSTIDPQESFEIKNEVLSTQNLPAGAYNAKMTLRYNNKTTESSTTFNIGKEDVELVSFSPSNLTVGEINEVTVVIRNLWNGNFQTYAILNMSGTPTKTSSVNMQPFGEISISQFTDTRSLAEGNYTGSVKVYFGNNTKDFPIEFSIVPKSEPEKERESPNLVVISLGVLIVILVLVLLLTLRKNKKK